MRFVALDSWRGICALMVTFYHLPIVSAVLDLLIVAVFGTAILGTRFLVVEKDHLVFASPILASLAILAFAVVLVALSGLTYRWIEQPGRAIFSRLANRIPQQAGSPATA